MSTRTAPIYGTNLDDNIDQSTANSGQIIKRATATTQSSAARLMIASISAQETM